jgi:hypothetical protein
MTTLANCIIDGTEVLIAKEENSIEFAVVGTLTESIHKQCDSIRDINAQAYLDRRDGYKGTSPAPHAPQVKPKGLIGWIRRLALARTPTALRTALNEGRS